MTMRFSEDERALSVPIAVFFGTIIIGFLLYIVLEPAADTMLLMAERETSRESSAQGQAYIRYAFSNMHLIVIGFGLLQLIVAATWEARLGGVRR